MGMTQTGGRNARAMAGYDAGQVSSDGDGFREGTAKNTETGGLPTQVPISDGNDPYSAKKQHKG